jgi:hypothetical protein
MKNSPGIFEKGLPGCADFHATRKSVEQFATYFLLQILNLSRERGLSYAKPLGGAPVMFFAGHRHEVAQMSEFHFDTLSASVQS